MSTSGPFVDRETNELQIDQIITEAVPLLGLIVLFGVLGGIPVLIGAEASLGSVARVGFTLLGQLILAVGGGIVLMYSVARGIQLADDDTTTRPSNEEA